MREIQELLWDEFNIAHIARHDVTPNEVEEAVFGDDAVAAHAGGRRDRIVLFGETLAGRLLAVFLDTPTSTGSSFVVTARPMSRREAREYQNVRQTGEPGE